MANSNNLNPYQINITDQSPLLTYSPSRDGNYTINDGWKVFYSGSPDSSYQPGTQASGSSVHSTSLVGAQVSIDFFGSAITLSGSASGNVYSTNLDGQESQGSPSNGVLFSKDGLDIKKHNLVLNVTQAQTVNITAASITAGIGKKGTAVIPQSNDAVTVSGGNKFANPFFTTSSGSTFTTDHDSDTYTRLDTNSLGATISFTVSNASGLVVTGTSNFDHETYSVSMNPAVGATTSERVFNSSSRWFALDNVIFFESGLDPSTAYNVQFKNLVSNKYFDIHSATLLESSADSSSNGGGGNSNSSGNDKSSSLSSGTIAGIAVGALVVAALAILVLCLWRRQRRRLHDSYNMPQTHYDESKAPYGVFPYPHTPNSGTAFPSAQFNHGSLSFSHTPPAAESHHLLSEYSVSPYGQNALYNSSNPSIASPGIIPPSKFSEREGLRSGVSSYAESSRTPSEGADYAGSTAGAAGLGAGAMNMTPSGKTTLAPPANPRRIRQEVDGGTVLQPAEQEEVLPPTYNQEWSSPR